MEKHKKYGYGACKSAALSAFLKVDNRHFFSSSCETPCCVFYKAFLSDPIGSSQELTLRATIAIVGSVSSRQLLCHVHLISLKRDYMGCMISYDPMFGQWPVCLLRVILWIHLGQLLQVTSSSCYNVSRTSCKLLDEDVNVSERLASYLTKMLQGIRNILQVTYRRRYSIAGTSWKLLEEDVTRYQERLASYLTKMLQRIRNVLQVTWRRCYKAWKLLEEDVPTYQEGLASYLTKMLQRSRNVLEVTWRRCYNVSGTFCKLLDEDVTTYQERLESYLKKMLQRIRNGLKATWRRCYNVSGTSWKLLTGDVTA